VLWWSSLDRKVGGMDWIKRVTRGGAPGRGCDLGAALAGVITPLRPVEQLTG
jgi:hypothetical protein